MFYRILDIYKISSLSLFNFILVFIRFRFYNFIPNYKTSKGLSDVIIELINFGIEDITYNEFFIKIKTKKGLITGWNNNLYYAWFGEGSVDIIGLSQPYSWENSMPTFSTLLLLYICILSNNDNIYKKQVDYLKNLN